MRLKALDSDNDGDVTLAEFLKPSEDRFAQLDKANTGFIDAAALTAAFKARSDDRIDRMMKRLDRDNDGKVSLAEYLDGGRGHKGMGHHRQHRRRAGPDSMGPDSMAPGMGPGMAQGPEAQSGDDGRRGRGWHGRHHGRFGGGSTEERIATFKAMDKGNDGFLDKAELQAAAEESIAYGVKRMLHTLDADKDGRITRDEFLAPSKQRFALMDLTGDGRITADDLPPHARQRWKAR